MNLSKPLFSNRIFLLVFLNFIFFTSFSQVGIGTVNPDPTSMLDVSSTTQGILAPRMTTVQRLAIFEPANGLLVYDLAEHAFYYYDKAETEWVKLSSSNENRDNFVLVKSLADFPQPSLGIITLVEEVYYEINGIINLAGNTINLNNAFLSGLDSTEDILIVGNGNTAFQGSTGGSIRNITITGGGVAFNISGTSDQRLLLQNTFITNLISVGTISGLGFYFSNTVAYFGNTSGITYSNINNLLLTNQGWFENNSGIYETFTGTFPLFQKVGGFSSVSLGSMGIDVSSNPNVTVAVLLGTVFDGAGTYVNGYTTGTYPGYNFNKSWGVESPGIPLEIDAVAFGNIYITAPVETTITTINVPVKINGTTSEMRMFRASSPVSNRIEYNGSVKRVFNIQASLSGYLPAGSNVNYTFFIAKNGVPLIDTAIKTKFAGGAGGSADVRALSFTGTVDMAPDDFIEIFVENNGGTENIIISTMNLLIF